jgi:hypothetical protein
VPIAETVYLGCDLEKVYIPLEAENNGYFLPIIAFKANALDICAESKYSRRGYFQALVVICVKM